MDERYRHYHDHIASAVKAIDPEMLVAEAFRRDVAKQHPEVVQQMKKLYVGWSKEVAGGPHQNSLDYFR